MAWEHKRECKHYGGEGSQVRRAFVTIIEPGKIPDGKGPFLTRKHLDQFLYEAIAHRPDRSTQIVVHQLTWNDELWTECGREMIEMDEIMASVDDAALTNGNAEGAAE